jgi:hypothetical protein
MTASRIQKLEKSLRPMGLSSIPPLPNLADKQTQWRAFQRRMGLVVDVEFPAVITAIKGFSFADLSRSLSARSL